MESMGVLTKKQQHLSLPVPVRTQLVALYKELAVTTKLVRKMLGDPRSVVRPCKGCGRVCSARELRTHDCKVARSRR
jgi:hypothetical protein